MTVRPRDTQRDPKREFSFSQKVGLCARDAAPNGDLLCACCGKIVGHYDGRTWTAFEPMEFDHVENHGGGGRTDIENGRILCVKPCHRAKSAAETTRHADAERQAGRAGQYQRRISGRARPWPKRPFAQPWGK